MTTGEADGTPDSAVVVVVVATRREVVSDSFVIIIAVVAVYFDEGTEAHIRQRDFYIHRNVGFIDHIGLRDFFLEL